MKLDSKVFKRNDRNRAEKNYRYPGAHRLQRGNGGRAQEHKCDGGDEGSTGLTLLLTFGVKWL